MRSHLVIFGNVGSHLVKCRNKIPFTTLNNETASWLLLSASLVTVAVFCDLPKSRAALTFERSSAQSSATLDSCCHACDECGLVDHGPNARAISRDVNRTPTT